jgi:hypothetical protein
VIKITLAYKQLKISEDECWQILDENNPSTSLFDLELSRDGNRRTMLVGFTKDGNLSEADEVVHHIHIFHAMKATKAYEKLYSKRK